MKPVQHLSVSFEREKAALTGTQVQSSFHNPAKRRLQSELHRLGAGLGSAAGTSREELAVSVKTSR